MKSKIIRFTLIVLFIIPLGNNSALRAQHCQYDYSRLVGVRPMTSQGNTLDGLRITLVDETGKPIVKSKDVYKGNDHYLRSEYDTVEFWRNPEPNSDTVHKNRNRQTRHFIQAFSDYICIVGNTDPAKQKKTFIKIEDPKGRFKTEYILLDNSKTQHLCGYPNGRDFKATYNPILIYMTEANPQLPKRKEIRKHPFTFYFAEGTNDLPPPQCSDCFYRHLQILNSKKESIGSFYFLCNQSKYSADGADSMQVDDYNFDGYPDVRLFNFNLAAQKYYLYNPFKDTFEFEPLLSKLNHLYFNPKQKKAIGSTFTSDNRARSFVFEGINLENVSIVTDSKPGNHWRVDLDTSKMLQDTQLYYYVNHSLVSKSNGLSQPYSVIKHFKTLEFRMDLEYEQPPSYSNSSYRFKKKVSITDIRTNKSIFQLSISAGNTRNICTDSLELDDYNFDGYPDLKVCKTDQTGYNYYVFDTDSNTFVREPYLSTLSNLNIDHQNKIITGYIKELDLKNKITTPGGYYYNTISLKSYLFRGNSLKEVQEIVQATNKSGKMISSIRYYTYNKYRLDLLETKNKANPNTYSIIKDKFKFVIELNPIGMVLPAEKGAFGKRISVYTINNENLIYTGDFIGTKSMPGMNHLDSIYLADYNFDGYIDFMTYKSRGMDFFVYSNTKNTFVHEQSLSQMAAPVIDFKQQTVTSEKQRLDKPTHLEPGEPYYIFKQYQFKGPSLRNATITYDLMNDTNRVTEHYYYINGNLIPLKDKKEIKKAIKSTAFKIEKTVGDFRFEITFNAKDFDPQKENIYAKTLRIYRKEKNDLINDYKLYGNIDNEPFEYLDSLYIEDYNFDGYPDIRIYNSSRPKHCTFFTYNPIDESFQVDQRFTNWADIEFSAENKTISGIYENGNTYTKYLLHIDTLFAWPLPMGIQPPKRYLYKNGGISDLPPLPTVNQIKEIGDYNFDGHQDYRTKQVYQTDLWDVYIFDTLKNKHVKDTFLSKLNYLTYDAEKKTLTGLLQYYTDKSLLHFMSESYEWQNGKMTLIGYMACEHAFRFSERKDCAVYKLIDGQMIQVDFIHGAE